MKAGKWRLGTQMKGFRPKAMTLDLKAVRQYLWRIWIGCNDNPLLESRIGYWLQLLELAQVDDDIREVSRQIKYYTGEKPEGKRLQALAEINGWLKYLSMQIISCPEPKPFNRETAAARIVKESHTAPDPLKTLRMQMWAEQIRNGCFQYVKRDMIRYAGVKQESPWQRTVKAIAGWMDKLEKESLCRQ